MQASPTPQRPQRWRKARIALLFRPMASPAGPAPTNDRPVDVVVIGGGMMSVTLATCLQEPEPNWRGAMFERLGGVAEESSNGWNNAGTGHSGFAARPQSEPRTAGNVM